MITALKTYPAMKDSGVPWLGEVPEHWGVRRLRTAVRNVIEQVPGHANSGLCVALEHVESGTGRLTPASSQLVFDSQLKAFRAGDVLFGKLRPYLAKVTRPPTHGACVGEFLVLRARTPETHGAYMASLVRSKHFIDAVNSTTLGAKMPRAEWGRVGVMVIPLPPLPEQAAIVRFLDYYDRRIRRYIRAKQKLIKLLEEEKHAIIHRAVTGQIDVRTGKPYPRYKPSGVEWLGDVPEGWEVVALKRVLRRLSDCEHRTAPAVDNSVFYVVRTAAVRNGRLCWQGTYCTSEAAYGEWTQRGRPEPNDVIFTREAPAGEACIVPVGKKVCLGQRTVLLKPRFDVYDSLFLVHMIYAGPPRVRIQLASQGSTVDHFNMDDIGWMPVLKPSLVEQQRICEYLANEIRQVDVAADLAVSEITLLREYRTRLIADVVTGKLDVREAAAPLPDEPDEADEPEQDAGLDEGEDGLASNDESEQEADEVCPGPGVSSH